MMAVAVSRVEARSPWLPVGEQLGTILYDVKNRLFLFTWLLKEAFSLWKMTRTRSLGRVTYRRLHGSLFL